MATGIQATVHVQTIPIFPCTLPIRPWFDPLLVVLRYVTHFRYVDDVMFAHNRTDKGVYSRSLNRGQHRTAGRIWYVQRLPWFTAINYCWCARPVVYIGFDFCSCSENTVRSDCLTNIIRSYRYGPNSISSSCCAICCTACCTTNPQQGIAQGGGETICLPPTAVRSKNRGGSTSVRGRVRSPHISAGRRWLSCRQPACL